jgi:thiamine biosynthesis lipoprotein
MRFSRRGLMISATAVFAASVTPAWSASSGILEGRAFGASWRLVSAGGLNERIVRDAIEAVVESVDAAMSPFRADSEISRFNRTVTADWQVISAETCAVVREGLRVAGLTHGAFNPTVGPLVGRFGFGPIKGPVVGAPSDIAVRDGVVRKLQPALSLDLCGIAKGHALDRIVVALTDLGLTDFLLELGGEVHASGRHPAGRDWQVGVERPGMGAGGVQCVVALGGMALATSGDAINSYRHGGRRYSHIIDPLTRQPTDTPLASVTVLATTAMTADALATGLYAMGPERGPAYAEGAGVEALFLTKDGDTLRAITTAGFGARILA